MSETSVSQTFEPGVTYRDPKAALRWLEQAFGFEISSIVEGADGTIGHAEMRFGNGIIGVGAEWADPEQLAEAVLKSPMSVSGANTQTLHVRLEEDIDAHCERARSAGARILRAPANEFWGDRRYRAMDLEGHVWSFLQHIRDVSQEEMRAASGLNFRSEL
jgi:uncharacterized glyoxalase superfamily protein PhnB